MTQGNSDVTIPDGGLDSSKGAAYKHNDNFSRQELLSAVNGPKKRVNACHRQGAVLIWKRCKRKGQTGPRREFVFHCTLPQDLLTLCSFSPETLFLNSLPG